MPYFNYSLHASATAAASYWQRRAFVHAWWAIGRDDDRWTPPRYGQLQRELDTRHNEHLARLRAELIHIEALHRTGLRRSRTDQQEIPLTSVLERPLAAAVAAIDPRRGATAHLALLSLADDKEAFDRLYDHLSEVLSAENTQRVVGPVGLSPHLGSGLLIDSWDAWPPQHTPANPPYLPELLERRLRVLQQGRLYHAAVPARPDEAAGPATLRPLDPVRLAGDLLPLLVAATDSPVAGFPPPDAAEAAFLLRAAGPGAFGVLAEIDGQPAGFALLAPDVAGRLRATRGGRPLWGRAALALLGNRPVNAGRLLFGAVLPAWRRQGVGRQVWAWALVAAAARGWRSLTAGPVWLPRDPPRNLTAEPPAAALFLAGRGAVARQTYRLYERSF